MATKKKAPATKAVKCGECDTSSKILATSVEKEGPTLWKCPECGVVNTIEK